MEQLTNNPIVVGRVAVISDVHGNTPALDAVLTEVMKVDPEVVVNLGCLTYGPDPNGVVQLLRDVSVPVLSVRGNGDRAVLELVNGELTAETPRDRFAVAKHDEAALAFLRETKPMHQLTVDGLGAVVFCHGSPRSDIELITPRTPEARFKEALDNLRCDVLVTGHTHLQFDRSLGTVRSVGPGSVGMPYHDGPLGARWALFGPEVELRVTPYDHEAAAAVARQYPDSDRWIQMLLEPPSEEEVILDAESREFSD
ncbi:metallophosphoesterase family protein [Kribbella swartbergensis]